MGGCFPKSNTAEIPRDYLADLHSTYTAQNTHKLSQIDLKKLENEEYGQVEFDQLIAQLKRRFEEKTPAKQKFLHGALLDRYRYEVAKYCYRQQRYRDSLVLLQDLVQNPRTQIVSKLNLQIFCFHLQYMIKLREEKFQSLSEMKGLYLQLIQEIIDKGGKHKNQMVLFVSNLIYHLYWCSRIKWGNSSYSQTDIEREKMKQVCNLVQKYIVGLTIRIQNKQIIQNVTVRLQKDKKFFQTQLIQQIDHLQEKPIQKQQEIVKLIYQEYLKSSQSLSQIECGQSNVYLIEKLKNQQHPARADSFIPFWNLNIIYFPAYAQQGWIKIFKNATVTRQKPKDWYNITRYSMAIEIVCTQQQNKQQSQDFRIDSARFQYKFAAMLSKVSQTGATKNGTESVKNNKKTTSSILTKVQKEDPPEIKRMISNKQNQEIIDQSSQSASPEDKITQTINQEEHRMRQLYDKAEQLNVARGLKNIGNTCYMNSVLQCLHKSKDFTCLLSTKIQLVGHKYHSKVNSQLSQLLLQLSKQMNKQGRSIDPRSIKDVTARKNYIFANYNQNDATQFLSTLLAVIDEQLNQSRELVQKFMPINHYPSNEGIQQVYKQTKRNDWTRCKSILQQTFTGRYKVTYSCQRCNSNYVLFQKFNIHYLQIPDEQAKSNFGFWRSNIHFDKCHLKKCLELFQKEDILEGENAMTCDKCTIQTKHIKTMQIFEANKIFVIAVKRFYQGIKNQTEVIFPETLSPSEIMVNRQNPLYAGKVYKMYAAILHSGNLRGGHYVAVCLNQKTKKWMHYNDSVVYEPQDFKQISLKNAYAVFYKLSDSADIKQGTVTRSGEKIQRVIKPTQAPLEHVQAIKCLLRCLFKAIDIFAYYSQQELALISESKGEITQQLLRLNGEQRQRQLSNDDLSVISLMSRDTLQQCRSTHEYIRQLFEFYMNRLDEQLKPAKIQFSRKTCKMNYLVSKTLFQKNILFVGQEQEIQYADYVQIIKNKKELYSTNRLFVVELQVCPQNKELSKKINSIPLSFYPKNILHNTKPAQEQSHIYRLTAVISLECDKNNRQYHSLQYYQHYLPTKCYKYISDQQIVSDKLQARNVSFPNAQFLFYESFKSKTS